MESRNYRIIFTPVAIEDLEAIYRFISKELHAEGAASNLMEKIEASIMRLKVYPFSCNRVEDQFLRKKGYRKLIVENYIAFYLVVEEKQQVTIMRVLYSGQKYQRFL